MHAATLLLVATMLPAAAPRSHPPMRALPAPSRLPPAVGPAFFVDAVNGEDANDGSRAKPWKTIVHGLKKLQAGETLVLRGGVFYESLTVTLAGTVVKPVTIRSESGELAIIDAGLREFAEAPAAAWEPVEDGGKGEFRST